MKVGGGPSVPTHSAVQCSEAARRGVRRFGLASTHAGHAAAPSVLDRLHVLASLKP